MNIFSGLAKEINDFKQEIPKVIEVPHNPVFRRLFEVEAGIAAVENSLRLLGKKDAAAAKYGQYMTSAPEYTTRFSPMLNQLSPQQAVDTRGTNLAKMPMPVEINPHVDTIDLNTEPEIDQFFFDQVSADPVEAELQDMIVTEELKDMTSLGQHQLVDQAQADAQSVAMTAEEAYAHIAKIAQQ